MQYDVIVVGAGPAGSTAAFELARSGATVALLEQHRLPRYKPCGGCISAKADRILDPDFHQLVEKTIYAAALTFNARDEIVVRTDRPVAYMVMRDRFDQFLAEKACGAGADLRDRERVIETVETCDSVRVRTSSGELSARYLIAADGANGIVGRSIGRTPKRRATLSIEAEVVTHPGPPPVADDEVRMELGVVPGGYGWMFPKSDHASIGIWAAWRDIGHPRPVYEKYLADQDLTTRIAAEKRRGSIIPVFAGGGGSIAGRRTLLAGDAAALVDPFLGEGIYYALRSGQLAADAIGAAVKADDSSQLARYRERLEREMYGEFRAARNLAILLYTFQRTAYRVLKHSHSPREWFVQTIRGDMAYTHLWRNVRRGIARKLLSRAGL